MFGSCEERMLPQPSLNFNTHIMFPHPTNSSYHYQKTSKNEHVIAFNLYGKGNNQCAKKLEGTYIMDVGKFAKAYVGQMTIDYQMKGNEYGGVDAIDYTECTAVEYNDVYVSFTYCVWGVGV